MRDASTAAVVASLVVVSGAHVQRPIFHADVAAVEIHVLVEKDRRPADGLTVREFELFDNDVRQDLIDATLERGPIQLAVAVDLSASITGPVKTAVRSALDDATSAVRSGDSLELYSLASGTRRLVGPAALDDPPAPDGMHTALLDGLAALLLVPVEPEKRRVLVVLTDGIDTNSVVPRTAVLAVAGRAPSAAIVVAIDDGSAPFQLGAASFDEYAWVLKAIADRTGGEFIRATPETRLRDRLRYAIDSWRLRYVLRYQPKGVASQGWHSVRIRVTAPGQFMIRARTGYQGRE